MTAAALTPSKEYIENGLSVSYPVPFRFRDPSHIAASRVTVDGTIINLVYNTDFTVIGGATDDGGTLVVTVPGASGTRLRIKRTTPRAQSINYTTADLFPAETHELGLDTAMLIDQEQDTQISDLNARAIVVPDGEVAPPLPKQINRINKIRLFGHASDGVLALLNPADIAKGDPGGNTMAIGLFITLAALTIPLGTDQVRSNGYSAAGNGAAHYVYDPSVDAAYVAANPRSSAITANGRGFRLAEPFPNVRHFGAVGDLITDDTAAINACKTYCIARKLPIRFPTGGYLYTNISAGFDVDDLTIVGDGSNNTILKCTAPGVALDIGKTSAFTQRVNVSGITIEGNSATTEICRVTAVARSIWADINLREADPVNGRGMVWRACMLSYWMGIVCSQDRQPMANPPAEAFNIEALAPFGNSSNNTFTNIYGEGAGIVEPTIDIGLRLSGADNNEFFGGSPESCKIYGLLIGSNCRNNSFNGMGFENLGATADVSDAGISTKYNNCYSSQKFIIQGQSIRVEGGYFERMQIDAGAEHSSVKHIRVNYWATGAGGFYDNGFATEAKAIYDQDAAAFIYPNPDRSGIAVGASPFTWLNNTGQFVEVPIQTGVLTQVRIKRGTDAWLTSIAVPHAHLLAPGDEIEVSYSGGAPSMSYVRQRGF